DEPPGSRPALDLLGLLFHELLETLVAELRDVLPEGLSRGAVPLEERRQVDPPFLFYGCRGLRVARRRGSRRGDFLARSAMRLHAAGKPPLLPGLELLLPEGDEGVVARLEGLEAETLRHAVDVESSHPPHQVVDFAARRLRRELQVAREEPLVLDPQSRDGA